jgi:ribonuclease VapC
VSKVVIDSSALVAVLEKEAEAELFLRVMCDAELLKISTVTYTEVSLVLFSRFGEMGLSKLDELLSGLEVEYVAFDNTQALLAISAWRQYGKGRHPAKLNFGDCCSYALAKYLNMPLLFKGNDFIHTDITRPLF